jgi:hypothetical protein
MKIAARLAVLVLVHGGFSQNAQAAEMLAAQPFGSSHA